MTLVSIEKTYRLKIDHTEKVYQALQQENPILKNGKSDLDWDEMWNYYDRLRNRSEWAKNEHLLLNDHLYLNLRKPCQNCFYKLPPNYFQQVQLSLQQSQDDGNPIE